MNLIDQSHPCYNNPYMLVPINGAKSGEPNPFVSLSARARRFLEEENIRYVGQLVTKTFEQLLNVPRIGYNRALEIERSLKKEGAVLGVPCAVPLRNEGDIIRFYCIEKQNQPERGISSIFVNIALPSALVEGLSDRAVIGTIKLVCQQAFMRVATVKAISNVDHVSTPSHVPFPTGEIRQIKVPLSCPESLNRNGIPQATVREISGVSLYPLLKVVLENRKNIYSVGNVSPPTSLTI